MEHERGGVIAISDSFWHEMFDDVLTIAVVDTQGTLREQGVFEEVHKRLLLPESYQIVGIFYKWMRREWNVAVIGADLPPVVEGQEYPMVTPIYQRNADGSNSLVRIDM